MHNRIAPVLGLLTCLTIVAASGCDDPKKRPKGAEVDTRLETSFDANVTCVIVGKKRNVRCWGQFESVMSEHTPQGYSTGLVVSPPFELKDDEGQPVEDVIEISVTRRNICAVQKNGDLRCWGRIWFASDSGPGEEFDEGYGEVILTNVTHVAASTQVICAAGKSTEGGSYPNKISCWGPGDPAVQGYGDGPTSVRARTLTDAANDFPDGVPIPEGRIIKLRGGLDSICAIISPGGASSSAGHAVCWGKGGSGLLGNPIAMEQVPPSIGVHNTPRSVGFIDFGDRLVLDIRPSTYNTCALITVPANDVLSSGVRCWGNVSASQTGYTETELFAFMAPENFPDLVHTYTSPHGVTEPLRLIAPVPYDITLGFHGDQYPSALELKEMFPPNKRFTAAASTPEMSIRREAFVATQRALQNRKLRGDVQSSALMSVRALKARGLSKGQDHSCVLIDPEYTEDIARDSGIRCWGTNYVNPEFTGRYRGDLDPAIREVGTFYPIEGMLDLPRARELDDEYEDLEAIYDKIEIITSGRHHNCALIYPDQPSYANRSASEEFDWILTLEDNFRGVKCWGFGGSGALGYGDLENKPDMVEEFTTHFVGPPRHGN